MNLYARFFGEKNGIINGNLENKSKKNKERKKERKEKINLFFFNFIVLFKKVLTFVTVNFRVMYFEEKHVSCPSLSI